MTSTYSSACRPPLRCTFTGFPSLLSLLIVSPPQYSTEGKIKEPNLLADAGQSVMSAVTSYARGDMGGVMRSAMGLVKTAAGRNNAQRAEQITKTTRTSPADVVRNIVLKPVAKFFHTFLQISWSGCKDSQTSADTEEAGRATGAMSFVSISLIIYHCFLI